MTSTLIIIIFGVQVLPSICHRLITDPYFEQQYDSVIVSSDPITVKEKKQDDTTPLKPNRILKPQKRSYEECAENDFACLYGNKSNNEIVDQFLVLSSNAADVTYKNNFTDQNSFGKSYWSTADSQIQHHNYGDPKGWVTLDPVPWSKSKISRWQPNKVIPQGDGKPWIYESNDRRPVQQFWVSGSSLQAQKPSFQWGIGTNDVITDNGPSDFPTEPNHGNENPNQHVPHGVSYSHNENFHYNQGSFSDTQTRPLKGTLVAPQQNSHPSTYPSNGNGQWILLSTTKGYSHPRTHAWPANKDFKTELRSQSSRNVKPIEISRYHEENLNDKLYVTSKTLNGNRKSDVTADVSDSRNNEKAKPLHILYTGKHQNEEPMTMTKRKVKLQVLPAPEDSSTSPGALFQTDSDSQMMGEAQEEDEKLKNLKAIANVKKNRIRGYKLVPASKLTGKSSNHKNVMTLAAVGAGMIPATMALLVPMALGRRKRSFPPLQSPSTSKRFFIESDARVH